MNFYRIGTKRNAYLLNRGLNFNAFNVALHIFLTIPFCFAKMGISQSFWHTNDFLPNGMSYHRYTCLQSFYANAYAGRGITLETLNVIIFHHHYDSDYFRVSYDYY